MSVEEMVREFHQGARLPIGTADVERVALWHKLMLEEVGELGDALLERDVVEVADALADITYVAVGMAISLGIPFDRVFAEVHRSNMTKTIDLKTREDGKIIKGPHFEPPQIAEVLNEHR